MKSFLKLSTLLITILSLTACGDDNKIIFDSEIIKENDLKTISYIPKTNFVRFKDSAYQYMSKQDYTEVLRGELLKGETIFKNDQFIIKTMLRSYATTDVVKHQIILRTFKKNMRLLDDIVISSTVDSIPFSGKLNKDLTYEINYENGDQKTGRINEKGRFINDNDE